MSLRRPFLSMGVGLLAVTALAIPACHWALGDFEGSDNIETTPVESPVCPPGETSSCAADASAVNCSGGSTVLCNLAPGGKCLLQAGAYRCSYCRQDEMKCDARGLGDNTPYTCDKYGQWAAQPVCAGATPLCETESKGCVACSLKAKRCNFTDPAKPAVQVCQANTSNSTQREWSTVATCSAENKHLAPYCTDKLVPGEANCIECDPTTWSSRCVSGDKTDSVAACSNARVITTPCDVGQHCVAPATGPATCQ